MSRAKKLKALRDKELMSPDKCYNSHVCAWHVHNIKTHLKVDHDHFEKDLKMAVADVPDNFFTSYRTTGVWK